MRIRQTALPVFALTLGLALPGCDNTPEQGSETPVDYGDAQGSPNADTGVTNSGDDASPIDGSSSPDAATGGSTETEEGGTADDSPAYEPQRSKLIKADPQ